MQRVLRVATWTTAILAGLLLLTAGAVGGWLYHAARHKQEPDRKAEFIRYPDAIPTRMIRPPARFTVARAGERWEIVDSQGRVAYFRGVNVGQGGKVPPWRPIEPGDEDAFRQLQAWGFNAIRLVTTWEALEPEPRTFNLEHLSYIRWFLDMSLKHGISVILDNHHDEVSRCLGGDGAPRWAHRPGTIPEDHAAKDCRYVGRSGLEELPLQLRWWADFYDGDWTPDDLSLQDHAIWAWQKLAEVLRGHPALLGYGPLNEPHCYPGLFGDIFDPMRARCETALSDYYERFAKAIRAVDSDALIFFEPPRPRMAADWDGNATNVVRPPVEGAVFSVHYYNVEERKAACDGTWNRDECRLAEFLDATGSLATDRFDAPRVLTEYGVHHCKTGAAEDLAHQALDIEDASSSAFVWNYFKSGETWGMTGFRDGGEDMSLVVPQMMAEDPSQAGMPRCLARSLIRPYPTRVSGTDARWSFDRSFENYGGQAVDRHHDGRPVTNTDTFTFTFKQGDKATDTFLWVPRFSVFGDDPSTEVPEFTVDVSDGRWRWSESDPNLLVWTTTPGVPEHSLTLKPWGGRRAPGEGIDRCVAR